MFSIIKLFSDEFREDDLGVKIKSIYFLGIPIYRSRVTTTNNNAVRQLTVLKESKFNIKGFKQ